MQSVTPVCIERSYFQQTFRFGAEGRLLLLSVVVKEMNAKVSLHLKEDQWWVKAMEHLFFYAVFVNG